MNIFLSAPYRHKFTVGNLPFFFFFIFLLSLNVATLIQWFLISVLIILSN